jgi:hypothetical protein
MEKTGAKSNYALRALPLGMSCAERDCVDCKEARGAPGEIKAACRGIEAI